VLEKVFKALKQEDVIKVKVESDSTSVKVHPDGSGALKKTRNKV
jgi:RNA-binding protein YhbY